MGNDNHIFISYSHADQEFVRRLRRVLEGHGLPVWTDERYLSAGDRPWAEIKTAIAGARSVIAVLGPQTVNSSWVRDEVGYAREIEAQREDEGYKVIPLLLPGMTPDALWPWFGEDGPIAVPIALEPGRLDAALPDLMAALGERLPMEKEAPQAIEAPPADELILTLTDPTFREAEGDEKEKKEGTRRAAGTARVEFRPADPGRRNVESQRYTFTAPLGAIELEEVRWYLEEYFRWPAGFFEERARRVEAALPEWGQDLFRAALGTEAAREAASAWRQGSDGAARRLSVFVERELPEGADDKRQAQANEAAAALLALPWELLHDGGGYLIHGGRSAGVRRRLPNREQQKRRLAAAPIRILLLSPRPEEEGVAYIDHRSSALALVEAAEHLGELARLTVLHPPTLPALEAELERAQAAGDPYDVVHFDGHGIYDRQVGLGALCFEDPQDAHKVGRRGLDLVHADRLASIVRDRGVPLIVLDACQGATVDDDVTASMAARLLEHGVTSVIAMTHSVLVESSRRFDEAFYRALAAGQTVGAALLAGQKALAGDAYRGKKMGGEELRLHDWFVPVLYQDEADPQLFTELPPQQAQALMKERRRVRLGDLPAAPDHGFIGRGRELLRLERILANHRYAVVRGVGGEGKTALAVETARWLARTGRCRRVAFASLETTHSPRAVLDRLGRQLLPGQNYSVAEYDDVEQALQPVERALREEATLILLDNMESVLPDAQGQVPEGAAPVDELLAFFEALLNASEATHLLFTSREPLPAPFDAGRQTIGLDRLSKRDAVRVVEAVMAREGWEPAAGDAGQTPEEVQALVDAVDRHARALVLLAREVARRGVTATTADLQELMADLERKHPGQRENSLYASVELSLRRLPDDVREKVQALAVLHGGGNSFLLRQLMETEQEETLEIGGALIGVGLAEEEAYSYLRLDPALPPYLLGQLDEETVEELRGRWAAAMIQLVNFLYQQQFQDAQLAAQVTLLELPNLLALLDWLAETVEPETAVDVAGRIEQLLANLGRPRALARAVAARESAAGKLGEWSRAQFENERLGVERLLQGGDLRGALAAAERLLQRARAAGEEAYDGAAYDIAGAHYLLGQARRHAGRAGAALEPLAEAQRRFQALAGEGNESAAAMAGVSLTEQADCLRDLGRLEAAAAAYEEAVAMGEERGYARSVAVDKGQLGTVRMLQERYEEALAAHREARDIFQGLGEPAAVATAWHQMGMVHSEAGQHEAAEGAYRQSLALEVQEGDRSGEADTLNELGNLYNEMGQLEEAVRFHRQAADVYVEVGDQANEGRARGNLANVLRRLGRTAEARQEIRRAIACNEPFGYAAEPWKTWGILQEIERAEGNEEAADAAWRRARDAYLAYRRDGGYPQFPGGKLCEQIWQAVQAGGTSDAEDALAQVAEAEEAPDWYRTLASKLQAVLAGQRDPALAEDTALGYSNAAELLLLLERMGR